MGDPREERLWRQINMTYASVLAAYVHGEMYGGDYPRPLWLRVALDMCCDALQWKKVAWCSQDVRAVDFSTQRAFLPIEFIVKLDA